jgi:adenosylmethionine-8-amino-7-oxononanoate aminotransferase
MERPTDMRTATKAAMDAGVWIRPFGTLLYVMPPFVTPEEDVERIAGGLVAAARVSGVGG